MLEKMLTRRSIRKFKSDMVPKEVIEKIVEAGTYAASGMNRQPGIIVAVTNKELRDKIAEKNRQIGGFPEGMDPFYGAPVILIVIADVNVNTPVYDGSISRKHSRNALVSYDLGRSHTPSYRCSDLCYSFCKKDSRR